MPTSLRSLAFAGAALLAVALPPAVAQQPLPAQSVPAPASDRIELSELQQVQKLMAAGEWKPALARADAHLASNPRDAQMRFVRGVILSELKDTAARARGVRAPDGGVSRSCRSRTTTSR